MKKLLFTALPASDRKPSVLRTSVAASQLLFAVKGGSSRFAALICLPRRRLQTSFDTADVEVRSVVNSNRKKSSAIWEKRIEFVLSEEYTKEEYPKEGERVTVTGTFASYPYMEDQVYYTLTDADLENES